jgi:hypothetical protein
MVGVSVDDMIDFVRCHISADYRLVISGRRLLKHDTDRGKHTWGKITFTPDELIAATNNTGRIHLWQNFFGYLWPP